MQFREQVEEMIRQKYKGMKGAIQSLKEKKYVRPVPLAASPVREGKLPKLNRKYASPMYAPPKIAYETLEQVITPPPHTAGITSPKMASFDGRAPHAAAAQREEMGVEEDIDLCFAASFPTREDTPEARAMIDRDYIEKMKSQWRRENFFWVPPPPASSPVEGHENRWSRWRNMVQSPIHELPPEVIKNIRMTTSTVTMDGNEVQEREEYQEYMTANDDMLDLTGESEPPYECYPASPCAMGASGSSNESQYASGKSIHQPSWEDTESSMSSKDVSMMLRLMEMSERNQMMHNMAIFHNARRTLIEQVSKLGQNDQKLIEQITGTE